MASQLVLAVAQTAAGMRSLINQWLRALRVSTKKSFRTDYSQWALGWVCME